MWYVSQCVDGIITLKDSIKYRHKFLRFGYHRLPRVGTVVRQIVIGDTVYFDTTTTQNLLNAIVCENVCTDSQKKTQKLVPAISSYLWVYNIFEHFVIVGLIL